jgi:hypothetical protein
MVLGEHHLRRVLLSYATYYNRTRTYLSLSEDSPESRAILPPERDIIREVEHVGGLHHEHVRLEA